MMRYTRFEIKTGVSSGSTTSGNTHVRAYVGGADALWTRIVGSVVIDGIEVETQGRYALDVQPGTTVEVTLVSESVMNDESEGETLRIDTTPDGGPDATIGIEQI